MAELYSDEFISRRNVYGIHRIPWIMRKARICFYWWRWQRRVTSTAAFTIYFSSFTYSCHSTGRSFSCNKILCLVNHTVSAGIVSRKPTGLLLTVGLLVWLCGDVKWGTKRNDFDCCGHSQFSKVAWALSAGETLGPVCQTWRNCNTVCRSPMTIFFLVFRLLFLSSMFFFIFCFFLSFLIFPSFRSSSLHNATICTTM